MLNIALKHLLFQSLQVTYSAYFSDKNDSSIIPYSQSIITHYKINFIFTLTKQKESIINSRVAKKKFCTVTK